MLPYVVPGQGVDEIQGFTAANVVNIVLNSSSYTVPAGFTLVIHGMILANAANFVISGITALATVTATTYFMDRNRTAWASAGTGFWSAPPGYATTNPVPAAISNGTFMAETSPMLFWPIAAGQVISSAGGVPCSVFGTLHPN